jgi:hypothetical protein
MIGSAPASDQSDEQENKDGAKGNAVRLLQMVKYKLN